MKNQLNLKTIFAILIMGLSACKKENEQLPEPIAGEKVFNVASFHSLKIEVSENIQVTKGNTFSVKVKGQTVDIQRLHVEVLNNTLKIKANQTLNSPQDVEIHISMPALKYFEFTNKGKANIENFVQSDTIYGVLRGQIIATSTTESKGFDIAMFDDAKLAMKGKADNLKAHTENKARLEAYNFPVLYSQCLSYHQSVIYTTVIQTINAGAFDNSRIYFKGNPGSRFTVEMNDGKIIEE
jgi:Putative auto-transporter adhesin, head GIN domain